MSVPRISAGFASPFRAQVAALRLRLGNLLPTAVWTDLQRAAHERAFTVAGAVKADVLAALAEAVRKTIEEGGTLATFTKDFRRIVEETGWHGWTGEGTKKGEAWRIRTIYRTNMATSYAAGRMAQLVAGNWKYWVYRHGNALEPRLQHLAWDGIALSPDHPFWATHAPPNGWGCTCYVLGANTEAGIRRAGGVPGKTLPDGWDAISPKTGAPFGIDKGWDYAVGRSVAETVGVLARKLETLPPDLSSALIESLVRDDMFARWYADPTGAFPLARLSDADAARIGSTRRVAVLSAESAAKQRREHPELTVDDYAQAQAVIDGATETVQQDASRLIFIRDDGGGHVLVVKAVVEAGELFVVSFRKLSADAAKRDRDLRSLRRKAGSGADGGASQSG